MRASVVRLMLVALAAAGAVSAVPASAADGGMCQLSGTATFTKGPNTTDHDFTYTFSGDLTGCQSNTPGAPAAGKIATLLPAKASGSCASDASAGMALVTWADKSLSVVSYTTQAVTAGVALQGTVVPSAKVGKKTYKSTKFAGYGAAGLLTFQADPTQCAGSGVTSAPISGAVGLGRQ
jgi:hypothetical protein